MAAKCDEATSNHHHSAQALLGQIHEPGSGSHNHLGMISKREWRGADEEHSTQHDPGTFEVCDAIHILLPLVKDRYKFGICANIEPSELDVIMDQYSEPVQCLSNIVDRWNRSKFAQSWSTLAEVVEKMQGYDKIVASLRRMAIKTGKEMEGNEHQISQYESTETKKMYLNGNGTVVLQTDSKINGIIGSRKVKSVSQKAFLQFECACGECSVHDHFEGKKCGSKRTSQYPYLEVRGEPYETDIEIYLVEQTETMRDSFVNLMQDTRRQLQASATISYDEVQAYTKLLVAGKTAEYDKIKNAKNLFELQDALIETCCSWFNHGIIAKIRKNFLHKNACDNILEKYIQDFDTYCKRRCFECPTILHLETGESTTSQSKSQALVFKVEKDFHTTTLTDILQVKRALAKILRCEPHAINVCTVKEGCVEVHCRLLPAGAIWSISIQQVVDLKQLGVTSFKLEGKELMTANKHQKKAKGEGQMEPEWILELSHSPRLHNRKVSSFSFPSTVIQVAAEVAAANRGTATITPSQQSIPRCKATKGGGSTENRNKVICKIMDSERKYVRQLDVLLNGYQPALKEVTSARDLRLLFPTQLEPLMGKHEELLEQLELCVKDNHSNSVGDVFACICNSEFLNIYGAYLKEFKIAVKVLAKCEQASPQFCEQLSMCQHSFFCEGISLSTYLLSPVQRLPRYELLLQELLKHTPAKHPDSHRIANAIDMLHEGLIVLNRSIKLCLLASSVKQVQDQKSFRFLRSSRKFPTHQSPPHAIDAGALDCQHPLDNPKTVNQQKIEEDQEGDKMKQQKVHPAQNNSLRLMRNASTNSREEVGGWVKSRLSLYSNSSGTSGIGSISTYQSQLDLNIRAVSPIEQNPKLSFLSGSMSSSMVASSSLRSKSQRERGKGDKAQERGTLTRERNISWTNSRLFQRMRYASTANMAGLSESHPSLYWSEESIEAAMRQEQDIFLFDDFVESGRTAVSCSDLLLHCSVKNSKVTHLKNQLSASKHLMRTGSSLDGPWPEGGGAGDQLSRSTSTSSIESNSSTATSGIESVIQSQMELAEHSSQTAITKELNSSHLCTSLPLLTGQACCPSANTNRALSYS